MQKCIYKGSLDCWHLTKETKDEFLREFEPWLGEDNNILIEEDDEVGGIGVYRDGWFHHYYFYNHWYVKNLDGYYTYTCYSDDEFNELFELKNE
jgi:hypothetical protein